MSSKLPAEITQKSVKANGFSFRYHCCGTPSLQHPAVIFLHGFPSTSLMWAPVMTHVAKQGYFCIAFDQRGYSPEARPPLEDDYFYPKIAADVPAVADAIGIKRFHLVTHDHGSLLGWCVAGMFPDRLLSFTPLSVPHIDAFSEAMRVDEVQQKSSAYMHMMCSVGAENALFDALTSEMNVDYKSQGFPDYYLDDRALIFASKADLRKCMWWYNGANKAFLGLPPLFDNDGQIIEGSEKPARVKLGKIQVPTCLIWGKNDPYIKESAVRLCEKYVDAPFELKEVDCGHWMTFQATDEVNQLILNHLQKIRAAL